MVNLPTAVWSTVSANTYLCGLGGIEGNRIMAFMVYFVFQNEDVGKHFPAHPSCFSSTQFLLKQRLKAY